MIDNVYRVEPFHPADAEGVSRLFFEVYGDAYPVKMVYDPGQIIAAFEKGRYFPFVVHSASNPVIGYGALYRSAPYKGIYEFGQGIVSPDYRGAGIGRLLFEYVEQYTPTLPESEIYFGEAVCHHTNTQKACKMIKSIETGIEIDLMPGALYKKDYPVSGRVAVLDFFKTFVFKPHTVYVPEVYENILRFIYGGFDDSRSIVLSADRLPYDQTTEISLRVFEFAGVARVAVNKAGDDFKQVIIEKENSLLEQKVTAIQVWLKLSWPWIGEAVEALRNSGYFFGGLFPRWFNEDGILMQKIQGQPNWEGIKLYSQRAGDILNFIHDDCCTVQKKIISTKGDAR